MIRNTSLNAIELQTILTEIEATLNSRPLTYLYTDINDGPPLTPSQFLYGHRLLTLPGTEEDTGTGTEQDSDRFNRTSEIQPDNNACFLETMAKAILNRYQGTTFIAGEQKHIGEASGSS